MVYHYDTIHSGIPFSQKRKGSVFMNTLFDPEYPSWLALRHVNRIYSSLLRVLDLSEPHITIHKEDGDSAKNYQGYTYAFKDIPGDVFLEITSARTLNGASVTVYDREGGNVVFSFNDVGLVENRYAELIESIVEHVEDNETDYIFRIHNLLDELEQDHQSYAIELSYDEKILRCLKRIVSFYALYAEYGGVKIYPWIGEMFDTETKEEYFYGFTIDMNGFPFDKKRQYIFNGESSILSPEHSWAFNIDLHWWDEETAKRFMEDNTLAEFLYDLPEDFERMVFDESVKEFARVSRECFDKSFESPRSIVEPLEVGMYDFRDYFLKKDILAEARVTA